MGQRCIANECLGTTGFSYTLSLINGKYKMTILYTLMEFGVVRFNEMKGYIRGISFKTLSSNLKELEQDGLVVSIPRRGVMVSELSLSTILELIHIRKVMEPSLLRPYFRLYDKEVLRDFFSVCSENFKNLL